MSDTGSGRSCSRPALSSRFGSPKQADPVEPVLERVRRSRWTTCVVVLGAHEVETDARTVRCPDWERGPGASLRCGLEALPADAEAAVVVLGDGPELDPAAIDRVIAAWRERPAPVVAATYDGIRLHPVLLAREVWPQIPDAGAKNLDAVLVACDDLSPPGDVDFADEVPEETEAMELARPLAAEPPAQTSPLTSLRLQRKLTVEEAAKRAALWPEQVEWLEEGKLYRFQGQRHRRARAAALRDLARDRPPRGAPALGDAGRAARATPGRPLARRRRGARGRRRGHVRRSRSGSAAATAPRPRSSTARPCRRRGRSRSTCSTAAATSTTRAGWRASVGSFGYRIQHVTRANRFDYKQTRSTSSPAAPGSPSAWPRSSAASPMHPLPGGTNKRRLVVIVGPAHATG